MGPPLVMEGDDWRSGGERTNDEQHKVEEADVEAVEAPWIRPRGLEEGW